ncbi:MAG: ATP-binding cassette domain-containing protein [Pseudomonadota bacterium]
MKSRPKQVAPDGGTATLLQIEGLQKRFGGVTALDNFQLELRARESLCLIGPNGCGKTTLLRTISGETAPDQGSIKFDGQELGGQAPFRIARLGIARKFQAPSVIEAMSVQENIAVAIYGRRGLRHEADGTSIMAPLRMVELDHLLGQSAGTLAHGQKQWLEIGMLLAQEPRLLLLDEPTAGMTRVETEATAKLLKSLMQDHDLAMIVVEHDLRFVADLGLKTAVMLRGAIVRQGSYDEIRQDPFVREIYLGQHA